MSCKIQIDRCLCFGVSFATLRTQALLSGADSVAELQEHVAFGRKCGLCHPYVRRMLRTGETVFSEVVVEEPVRQAAACAGPSIR